MFLLHQKVDVNRMVQRIKKLANCSSSDYGVTRLSFTKESEMANQIISEWMREAGMSVKRDELNNLIGRYEGKQSNAPTLVVGSHLDSVIEAGKYDGILGVISAIEVVQTMFTNDYRPKYSIEVVAFCDEEGTRFHTTLLGSRAITGDLREEDLQAKDEKGITLADAMKEIGLDPSNYKFAAMDPTTLLGYIELHIEQGPILEQVNQACGIVSGIAGQSRYEFRIEGLAEHAGTVPVNMRKDALVGTSEMIHTIERIALQYKNLVATVGKLSVYPGSSNVIPGLVEGTLDIRSIDDETRLSAIKDIIKESQTICKRRNLFCNFKEIITSPAVTCSPRFINVIESALVKHNMKPIQIVSGAGHDAMAMASITEIGMIFVRCRDGLSHHPNEFVAEEDIRKGVSVLLDVVLTLTR